jgi:hypothetical protein
LEEVGVSAMEFFMSLVSVESMEFFKSREFLEPPPPLPD